MTRKVKFGIFACIVAAGLFYFTIGRQMTM